jgi:hypothetical protein
MGVVGGGGSSSLFCVRTRMASGRSSPRLALRSLNPTTLRFIVGTQELIRLLRLRGSVRSAHSFWGRIPGYHAI